MATRVCLMRHGETQWNAEGRLQGQIDIGLNAAGRAQAQAAARRLARLPITRILSSDLSRAADTAAAAGEALGLKVVVTPRWRERFFGDFQGLTHDEAKARFPDAHARFRAREPDAPLPGGGESFSAFYDRVALALTDLAAAHEGETVLVVAHGGALDMARRFATGLDLRAPRDYSLLNASLNWLRKDAAGWSLDPRGWGDVSHLETAHLETSKDEAFDAARAG
ncbi:histidine phosphatase family protein [Methylocella sp.]|uniref:histidine phosphatase family protein n=1 Tax=Methylocella sp. TaxID=1978226 RepID=UPI00378351F5